MQKGGKLKTLIQSTEIIYRPQKYCETILSLHLRTQQKIYSIKM